MPALREAILFITIVYATAATDGDDANCDCGDDDDGGALVTDYLGALSELFGAVSGAILAYVGYRFSTRQADEEEARWNGHRLWKASNAVDADFAQNFFRHRVFHNTGVGAAVTPRHLTDGDYGNVLDLERPFLPDVQQRLLRTKLVMFVESLRCCAHVMMVGMTEEQRYNVWSGRFDPNTTQLRVALVELLSFWHDDKRCSPKQRLYLRRLLAKGSDFAGAQAVDDGGGEEEGEADGHEEWAQIVALAGCFYPERPLYDVDAKGGLVIAPPPAPPQVRARPASTRYGPNGSPSVTKRASVTKQYANRRHTISLKSFRASNGI